jgi:repressor LexA
MVSCGILWLSINGGDKMKKISKKQDEILEFMKKEVREKGYPPSVREICTAVNLKSTSTVHGHLSQLEKKGYIRRDPSKPRAIEIIDMQQSQTPQRELAFVPIIGTVTAGTPIFAEENITDVFPIPVDYLSNKESFMLNVKGDSMIEAGIFDKDLILVQKQNYAQNGDIVVALIDDDYATVKTFYKEKEYIRLQPENSSLSPILVRDVRILGKVIGLFRKI